MSLTAQEYLEGLAEFGPELTDELQASELRTRLYVECRLNRCAIRLAIALALQKFPAARSDDQWHSGNKPFWQEYGEDYANQVKAGLEAQGVHLGPNDDYIPGLAKRKCDPDAVIHGHGARSQIAKAMNKMARFKEAQREAPRIPLAEDLVQEEIGNLARQDPGLLQRKSRAELREQVIEKHAPKHLD